MTEKNTPMRKSGFCAFPDLPGRSHTYCTTAGCECRCHQDNQSVSEA